MKRVPVLLSGALVLLLLAAVFAWMSAAPVDDIYTPNAPKPPPAGADIAVDAHVKGLIARAQLDYFVYPVPGVGRRLRFRSARVCPPHDIYLGFGIPSEDEDWILYRCSADGRLLWKALIRGGA